jgi:transcriptional accessory protein Tex/SPT6
MELKNKFHMFFNKINHKIDMKVKKDCQVIISPLLQSMLGFRQVILPAGEYVSVWVAEVKKGLNSLYVYSSLVDVDVYISV